MFKNGTGSKVWQHHDGSQLEWEPKWGRKAQPDNWVSDRVRAVMRERSYINMRDETREM